MKLHSAGLAAGVAALAASIALGAGSASAADLPPVYKAPPAPPPAAVSWSGCYVDAGWGYGMWDQDHYSETDPGHAALSATTTTGGRGWLGRAGVGCDYQLAPRWVVGVFGDYDFANIHGVFQDTFTATSGNEKLTGQWAVGARVGYLVTPSLLSYFDAGYTQARFNQISLSSPVPSTIAAHSYGGWFIGGGTEYALSDFIPVRGLFWRTEYRYSSFQSADLSIVNATGPTGVADHMTKYEQTIESGIVWRFNWAGRY